ncbi:MAG: serine/threonine protein kinase [Gammaproteobacteria bacterium]|nr:serine/threonine protein kinase [Gammaproteobacteria bacterium]
MKTHLGHYEIVSEIGRGGMGVVYRAFEPALNRHVAIKELSPSLAHDPQLVERFLREARSMAALSDPHIIQIHYIGTDEATAQPFFAMEFVEGDSLSAILKRDGKLDVENALKILHQTAQGLATAHDRGVIHRDIKPGNLMLSDRGQVKIADFGIALATQDISKKLTSTGEFVGTPGYLSPEVCLGKPIDQRSDIFSLGIVMFEMLSGHTPFSDESPLGLMLEVVKAEIPDIQQLNDDVDPQTAAILARMLAKEPEERFQSCHDLVAALEAHPAVARGGTAVKLARPAAPVDAATMVGAPTPMSTARKVTPPPVVRSGASQPAPAAAASDSAPTSASTRPSVLERPATKRGALWLPLAVAAVLVLSVAGGAFAFRAPIMDFVKGFGDGFAGRSSERAYESGLATGQASNPISTGNAAPSVAADTGADASSTTSSLGSEALAAIAQDQPASNGAQIAVENPVAATGNTMAQAENTAASTLAAANASIAAAQTAASGSAPDSTTGIPPAAAAAKSQTVASTAAPARPAAPPPPPRIAVIAIGDSAITGPARSRIESQLAASGFDLVDAEALGVYGDDLSSALNTLRRSATVAVVVRAEPVGSQELQYYGRVSEMYTANLTVRAYKTADRAPIGAGLREKVQFTTLNADTQAQGALAGGKLDRLVAELSPYRRRG